MTRHTAATCLALLAAAFGLARAQAPTAERPPLYEVEVLVFAQRDFNPGEELFVLERAAEPLPEPELLRPAPSLEDLPLELLGPGEPGDPPIGVAPPPAAEPVPAPLDVPAGAEGEPAVAAAVDPAAELTSVLDYRTGRRSLRFRPLKSDELALGAERRALERLSAYRPLLHVGWVQEVLSEREAQPFDLALLGSLAPTGTIRVHQSRFLHVTLDLGYRPAGAVAGNDAFGLGELSLQPRYGLRDERRVDRNKINYFDHPAFGVLIVVRPVPEAPTDAPATRPAA